MFLCQRRLILQVRRRYKMSKANVIRIDHIDVKKSDIEKVRKSFGVKDNVEALKKALDMAAGKIEIESIFEKYKGTKIKKVYD